MNEVNYIGLDAHSETSTFSVLNREGKMIIQKCLPTQERGILEFIRGLKGRKEIIFEEMHLSQWLYGFLIKEVDRLVVCSAVHLPKRRGPKNDLIDSHNLARHLKMSDFLVSVYHEISPEMNLRSLITGYKQVVTTIVVVKNMLSGLLKRQAISAGSLRKAYHSEEVIRELDTEQKRYVWADLQSQLDFFEKRKKAYLIQFKQNKSLMKGVRQIQTVPGIGVVFSNQLMAAIVTPDRFSSKHKFFSYCKLVKYVDVSDGKIYGRRHSFGRSDLKTIFETAAMKAIRGQSAIADYYEYQLELGKSRKTARNAVRRKLAAIVLTLLKTGKYYDDEVLKKELKKQKKALNVQMSR